MNREQLTNHLIKTGHLSEHSLSRTARPKTCPKCRQACIAGIDIYGLDTWLHPQPIDTQTELRLLLQGITTYSIFAKRDIIRRDKHWIRAYPPGHPTRPTHQPHHCH